ncbi:hypothetical protein I9X38_19120 [Bacillus mojavensis]|nr:hypothetical protein I9X38_19120 [Bacillus mojavensis]
MSNVHGRCATLSSFIAFDAPKHILDFTDTDTLCQVFPLATTPYRIEADLDCFCANNCINPCITN